MAKFEFSLFSSLFSKTFYLRLMLKTNNLSYKYPDAVALHFPDIDVSKGEHFLLLGQSGCGKTTLLHLLGGLLTPASGEVTIGETTLNQLSGASLDRFRGRHVGIVFQKSHFIASLSVQENLALAQHFAGVSVDNSWIRKLLDELSLGHKLHSKVNALSVGEQQRVAIARALVNKPAVILADEPTSALDDDNSERVVALLEKQAKAVGATLVIVTHDTRLKSHFQNQLILEPQNAGL